MTYGNGAVKIMRGSFAIRLDVQNFIKGTPPPSHPPSPRAVKTSKAEAIRSVFNGLQPAAAGGDAALNKQCMLLLFGA